MVTLGEFASWLDRHDIEIIHRPRTVTGGRNLTARHPDGLVVEISKLFMRSAESRARTMKGGAVADPSDVSCDDAGKR
jgi:hypothetical protein